MSAKQVLEKIPSNATIIGFSCLYSHCWPLVLEMAGPIRKKFPNALILAGGEHPTAMVEQCLESDFFDLVVRGEGEETLLELIQKYFAGEDWKSLTGIGYKKEDGTIVQTIPRLRINKIDDFPMPDWDSWSIENYIDSNQVTGVNQGRSIPILGSRGCPYACTFCSNPGMWTRRYIFRDAKNLVDEMEYFKEKYNLSGFAFMDLTFIVNRKKTMSFANELIERKLNVNYQLPAGTRCEAINVELIDALEKSGLKNFALAPESGDERILKAIKKQIKMPHFYQAVRDILKTEIILGCFVVIGFPEDDQEAMKKSLKMIRKLVLLGVHDLTISQFTPYPSSEYFVSLVKQKKISDDFRELSGIVDFYANDKDSFCDQMTSKQVYRWMIWMYLNFYVLSFLFRPWRVIKNCYVYYTKGIERTRYMRFLVNSFLIVKSGKQSRPNYTLEISMSVNQPMKGAIFLTVPSIQ